MRVLEAIAERTDRARGQRGQIPCCRRPAPTGGEVHLHRDNRVLPPTQHGSGERMLRRPREQRSERTYRVVPCHRDHLCGKLAVLARRVDVRSECNTGVLAVTLVGLVRHGQAKSGTAFAAPPVGCVHGPHVTERTAPARENSPCPTHGSQSKRPALRSKELTVRPGRAIPRGGHKALARER
jgi:hypothetical protein